MNTLGIVNLSYSNLKSLCYSLDSLNISYKILHNANEIKHFDKIILPGTSSFKVTIDELRHKSFDNAIFQHVQQDKYLLGICVGMQLLFSKGQEGGEAAGLDLIKGSVIPLKNYRENNKTFHIGWNDLNINNKIKLLENINEKENFYFVHSYHCELEENIEFSKTFFNDQNIIAVVNKNKIFGIQFHPEKSHIPGKKILKNFLNL